MTHRLYQEPGKMHPLIDDNRAAIEAVCREFGVARLEVFGSIMTDAFNEESDIDFIVHYPEGYDFGPWGSRLFDLEEQLSLTLGRDVDLVMTSALNNKWFRREANTTRTELFDASRQFRQAGDCCMQPDVLGILEDILTMRTPCIQYNRLQERVDTKG